MSGGRAVRTACLLAAALGAACADADVVTEAYATLDEARAAGALDRGWVPPGLPPGSYELREAHSLDSNRRWGLFNFPPAEGSALRALTGTESSVQGVDCAPPRRIEWWPVLLRESLQDERVRSAGLSTYAEAAGGLIFFVNWAQGRAYYCSRP